MRRRSAGNPLDYALYTPPKQNYDRTGFGRPPACGLRLEHCGRIVAEESIPNTREVLTAFAARYPAATFVMETGTHSPWISRRLASLGHPVLVANARKLRAIAQSRTKNNENESKVFARLAIARQHPPAISPPRR